MSHIDTDRNVWILWNAFGVWKYNNKAGVNEETAAKTQVVVPGITSQYNTLKAENKNIQKWWSLVWQKHNAWLNRGCWYRMKVNTLHLFVRCKPLSARSLYFHMSDWYQQHLIFQFSIKFCCNKYTLVRSNRWVCDVSCQLW